MRWWDWFNNSPLPIVLGLLAGMVPPMLVFWWLQYRWWQCWQRQHELEQEVREPQMSPAERGWHRQYLAREAAIKQEVEGRWRAERRWRWPWRGRRG
jgi:hypothetical protein